MTFLTRFIKAYFWIVIMILCWATTISLSGSAYYRNVAIHLFLATTLYLTLIERPSDVEFFKNIEIKGFWSLFFIKFHWEMRISLFSYLMQIVSLSLIFMVLVEISILVVNDLYKLYIGVSFMENANKIVLIVFIVLVVFIAIFKIVRDRKIR